MVFSYDDFLRGVNQWYEKEDDLNIDTSPTLDTLKKDYKDKFYINFLE